MNCEAIQYSDSMNCARCGLQWDVNDPQPPKCAPDPNTPFGLGALTIDPVAKVASIGNIATDLTDQMVAMLRYLTEMPGGEPIDIVELREATPLRSDPSTSVWLALFWDMDHRLRTLGAEIVQHESRVWLRTPPGAQS